MSCLKRGELQAAFDQVSDPKDWRAPIDFTGDLSAEEAQVACQAIRFFTASEPTLQELCSGGYRIKADGYRLGPAGP